MVYTLINSPYNALQRSHSYLCLVFTLIFSILHSCWASPPTPCLIVATVMGTHFTYTTILLLDMYNSRRYAWIHCYGVEAASACLYTALSMLKKNMRICTCGYRVLENFFSSNMGRTPPQPRSQSAEVHKPLTHCKRQRRLFMPQDIALAPLSLFALVYFYTVITVYIFLYP